MTKKNLDQNDIDTKRGCHVCRAQIGADPKSMAGKTCPHCGEVYP